MDVADLVELAPVQVHEGARRGAHRGQRRVDPCARVTGGDEPAAADGGVGEPGPVEVGRPDAHDLDPGPATASKTVSCGCQVRGSGPSSQDSSLSSRSAPGTSTS